MASRSNPGDLRRIYFRWNDPRVACNGRTGRCWIDRAVFPFGLRRSMASVENSSRMAELAEMVARIELNLTVLEPLDAAFTYLKRCPVWRA